MGRILERSAESETVYGLSHLVDGYLPGVECHDRFLRLETHVGSTHTLQPFQGLLDRDGSGTSRHAVHREHDRRRRGQRDVPDKEQAEEQGED
jgi:hypothetical protein